MNFLGSMTIGVVVLGMAYGCGSDDDNRGGSSGGMGGGEGGGPTDLPEGCAFLGGTEPAPVCGSGLACEQVRSEAQRRSFRLNLADSFADDDGNDVPYSEEELGMRLQCLTSWLTGIGLEPEVLTNLHMVIVNATFAVLEPVLESAVLDRYWIDCDGGDCSYCHELDESDCAEDAFCAPYLGWPNRRRTPVPEPGVVCDLRWRPPGVRYRRQPPTRRKRSVLVVSQSLRARPPAERRDLRGRGSQSSAGLRQLSDTRPRASLERSVASARKLLDLRAPETGRVAT